MSNRVIQGQIVTPKMLAELVEGGYPMDAEPIQDTNSDRPEYGENATQVGYMPSVTGFMTAHRYQECDWADGNHDKWNRNPFKKNRHTRECRQGESGLWPSPAWRLTPGAWRPGRHSS